MNHRTLWRRWFLHCSKNEARRPRSAPGKERILDAAERLFAQRGFYGVSLRDITQAAGVDVALVSYHFGGKRELFAAVFERRAEVLNRERLELLEEVRRAALPGVPTIEAIVNAFTYPLLERSARGGPGWKSYFALVAHVNNSPEFGPVMMTRHFDPLVEKFIAVLREALPGCPPREIYWGYQFLTGALTLTFAETGRIDQALGRPVPSSGPRQRHAAARAVRGRGLSRAVCPRPGAATPAPPQRAGRRAPHRGRRGGAPAPRR